MKNHRFLWLRNRTTNNRKCEKARNIKEKRTIEMFSTVSRPPVALPSSPSVNLPPFGIYKTSCDAGGLVFYLYGISQETPLGSFSLLRPARKHEKIPLRHFPQRYFTNSLFHLILL